MNYGEYADGQWWTALHAFQNDTHMQNLGDKTRRPQQPASGCSRGSKRSSSRGGGQGCSRSAGCGASGAALAATETAATAATTSSSAHSHGGIADSRSGLDEMMAGVGMKATCREQANQFA